MLPIPHPSAGPLCLVFFFFFLFFSFLACWLFSFFLFCSGREGVMGEIRTSDLTHHKTTPYRYPTALTFTRRSDRQPSKMNDHFPHLLSFPRSTHKQTRRRQQQRVERQNNNRYYNGPFTSFCSMTCFVVTFEKRRFSQISAGVSGILVIPRPRGKILALEKKKR